MARGYARLRERNQLTLPQALVEKMGLNLGDVVEFAITPQGGIELHPARIVKMGTPEAMREEDSAKEDLRQGRYTVIRSMEEFQQHASQVRKGERPLEMKGASPREKTVSEEPDSEKGFYLDSAPLNYAVGNQPGHLSWQQRREVEAMVEAAVKKMQSAVTGSRNILSANAKDSLEQR